MPPDVVNDLDEMTRRAIRLADGGEWDRLLELRDDCRAALERGLQLWPVASYCQYRLALDAPAPMAAQMLVADTGRFALGPLTEVVAVHHAWTDLAPHAPPGPTAALAAHERVVRGEVVDAASVDTPVLEVPLALQPWEPPYPLAHYKPEDANFPSPHLPPLVDVHLPGDFEAIDDVEAADALRAIVEVWSSESNGRVEVAAVEGDALAAIAALGVRRARVAPLAGPDALALLAWAGASGGAHGRRRGMAPGRFAAWWAAVAVAGELDAWPLHAEAVGELVTDRLRWFVWDAAEPATGWSLRVAVEDPGGDVAYSVNAVDAA